MARATPSRPRAAPAAALLLVLLLPAAAGQAIAFAGQQHLYQEVQPSPRGAVFSFRASFALEAPGEVYLKVVPAPSNPAYGTGTPSSGWWTEASLQGPGARPGGGSNGTRVIEFGDLAAHEVYTLYLNVTVPPGALAAPVQHHLRYVVAVRSDSGTGSGGQLDPSLTVNPRLVVSTTATSAVPTEASAGWLASPPVLGMGAAAAAIVVGLAVLALRSRRRRA